MGFRDDIENAVRAASRPIYDALRDQSSGAGFPAAEEFCLLAGVAYRASLLAEEGTPTRCSMAMCAEAGVDEKFVFQKAENLDEEMVRKLAPAADFESAALGVAGGKIWGVVHRVPRDAVVCTARKPGNLVFRRGNDVVGTLDLARADPLDGKGVLEKVRQRLDVPQDVFQLLVHLAGRIGRLGHGGAAIVTPAVDASELSIKYEMRADPGYEALAEAQGTSWSESLVFQRRLDHVANLAAVDGALVLNSSRLVLGFGATIRGGDERGLGSIKELEVPGLTIEDKQLNDVGHRHKSAAWYAWKQKESTVLVVSQDGHTSLMRSKGDSLLMVTRVDRAVPPPEFAVWATLELPTTDSVVG